MKLTVKLALGLGCLTGSATAGELRCEPGQAQVTGIEGGWFWVAADGQLYRLEKDAPSDAPDSAEVFCEARLGLVAIVLPAPRPGPEDAVPGGPGASPAPRLTPIDPERPSLTVSPSEEASSGKVGGGEGQPGEAPGEGPDPPDEGLEAEPDVPDAAAADEPARGAGAVGSGVMLARSAQGVALDPLTEGYAAGCQAAPGAKAAGGLAGLAGLFVALGLRARRRR